MHPPSCPPEVNGKAFEIWKFTFVHVLKDIENYFDKIVPEDGEYNHNEEGPDDMPAHIKSALTNTSLGVPIKDKKLDLGTWQGIFLFEHRYKNYDMGIRRTISMTVIA